MRHKGPITYGLGASELCGLKPNYNQSTHHVFLAEETSCILQLMCDLMSCHRGFTQHTNMHTVKHLIHKIASKITHTASAIS